uniref:Uncharacterized protein n=1 Tax=Anguilla anguilla TaxID=7936 RepID=A0A0E9WSN1_ANGAN
MFLANSQKSGDKILSSSILFPQFVACSSQNDDTDKSTLSRTIQLSAIDFLRE